MRKICQASLLAAAVLSLVNVAHAANTTTTTVGLSATISSFDNITCSTATVDFGDSITVSGLTPAQEVSCSVSSNDSTAVNVTAYVPDANPLTGTNVENTIPNSDIEWSGSSGGTYTAFAALTAGTNIPAGSDGAQVATGVTPGSDTPVNFYLKLNVPAAQLADTYSATMTVAITPGS